jgi:hypothetical protein
MDVFFKNPFPLERTLALVKPNAFGKQSWCFAFERSVPTARTHEIVDVLKEHGFTVLAR